jgi:vanillate O-demethylase monooxygenase subunit
VALAEEVNTSPAQVRLLGQPWVVARLDDELVAFEDACPHRGAPLSAGTICDRTLQCAYHGWRFDGSGRCVDIPAIGPSGTIPPRAALTAGNVVEHGGLIWLAPQEPITPLPPLAGGAEPPQYLVTEWAATAGHMMDNFLDVGHFAFSHAASFGVSDDRRAVDMTVTRDGWTVHVHHRHRARLVDSPEWEAGTAMPHTRTQRFRYDAPFTMRLDITYDDVPDEVTLHFIVQPVDHLHSRLYTSATRNDSAAARCTPEQGLHRAMLIIDEDRTVLEQVGASEFELEANAELHTSADRNTLALRRVLADLVDAADHRGHLAHPTTTPNPKRKPGQSCTSCTADSSPSP